MATPAKGWTRAFVDAAKAQVDAEIAGAAGVDPAAALAVCLERLAESPGQGPVDAVTTFVLVLRALALHDQGLTSAQIKRLAQLGHAALAVGHVRPESSKLSDLHADLHDAIASASAAAGRAWDAFAGHLVGLASALRSDQCATPERAAITASRLLLLGHGPLVAGTDAVLPRLAVHERLAALWLAGDTDALSRELEDGPRREPAEAARYAWMRLRLALGRTGDWQSMLQALGRGGSHDAGEYHLEGRLWARAVVTRDFAARLPTLRRQRERFSVETRSSTELNALAAALQTLEDAYDGERPFYQRLELALALPARGERVPRIEWRLLIQAALARWAVRHRQDLLAAVALRDYHLQSARLSDGRHLDALGTTADLSLDALRSRTSPTVLPATPWQGPATTATRRSGALFVLAAKVARLVTTSRLRSGWSKGAKQREIDAATMAKIAALLRRELGALKGPLQKIAQILSFAVAPLPEALQEALGDLAGTGTKAPRLDAATAQHLLEEAFHQALRVVLTDFEAAPLAVASIGQVHRATRRDGERVAVKIKYPGIDAAVAADLKALRLFRPLMARLCPSADMPAILRELEARLAEECDLRLEARNQEDLRLAFADDHRILIPRVHADLSTDSVLVMELVEGLSFADFVATASDAERAQAAASLYAFSMTSLLRDGILHADPHPGNFLFTPDGRVAVLDFGCVRRWHRPFVESVKALFRSVLEHDRAANRAVWLRGGFVGDDTAFDFDWQFEIHVRAVYRHFLIDEPHVITEAEVGKAFESLLLRNRNRRSSAIPPDHLFLMRGFVALMAVLARMQASVNWRRVLLPLLYESPDLYPAPYTADEVAA